MENNKQVMDIKELAEYLGIGKSTIYNLIRQKKIPASKIGKQYRFSREVVDSWLRDKIITKKDK
jgi:excisionase family DNA binding protein